ncbi:PAS domain-containing hybrid sensor histidine kinase/response regulator [Photobacterium sanguinicancri]|uniref:PAS domain-containing hybrid sensor histidine kinase/response regulator n=1 Tax=Photobacterium sanguinicancri TaxID=875932 RepID=UPI0007894B89|nr:PAS domain-containing hybrid sensor histidine kinase/response regulator [Photobacterium sanguinicancri]KXI21252.1 hybrid sensor histidine kinase/response regulator [Photobacterium sanguinicancri]
MMKTLTHQLSWFFIATITSLALYLAFIVTKSHQIEQYQRAYLSLSNNVIKAREELHYFNHQDHKAYDAYSLQLVEAEIKANALYNTLSKNQDNWLNRMVISTDEVIDQAKAINKNISSFVTDLETLLRLKVSNEYSTLTTSLLEEELLDTLKSPEDKLYVSELTLKGALVSLPSPTLQGNTTFQSLQNYISFRERIKAESKNKEKDIMTNGVKEDLAKQNNYWLEEAKTIKLHAFITMLLFALSIAAYFYLQLRERLLQTLDIQHKLSASEKEKSTLALVAEHAQDAIVMTDKEGYTTWVNNSFLSLSGYSFDDVIGKKPGDILQGENTSQAEVARISEALKQGHSIESELINYHKNGTPYWIDIAINPTFDIHGNLQSFIAVERDSTKRKALEQDLASAAKQAEVSNQAKSTFLATMSHELRTPLNGILGMAQIIESNIQDPENHKQIEVLLESGEHLLSLLNDILDFSKIEENKLELECTKFQFNDVINPIAHTYQQICTSKGLELVIKNELSPNATFNGDKSRIRQIIFNLISNAVKFTHQGTISLSFKHTLAANNQQGVTIVVKDSGIGIRQERLANIFDPFTQAESSTTRQYGGTGLGLAIVKQLVEIMNGHISVNSELGKGTEFKVTIALDTSIEKASTQPLISGNTTALADRHISALCEAITPQKHATTDTAQHNTEDTHQRREPQVSSADNNQHQKALKILIVEDNKINALVAKTFCQRQGYQASVAENGQVALERLKEESFDLVLMDNHMPVMDGVSATQAIRQELKLPTVIFACTADIFQEAHDNFIQAGANFVLTKPIQEKGFIEAINQHLPAIMENQSRLHITALQPDFNVIALTRHTQAAITELAVTEAEINISDLQKIDGNKSINEYLHIFIDSAEEGINSLIIAYGDQNIEMIHFFAQSISELADNYSIPRLINLTAEIQQQTGQNHLPKIHLMQQFINLLEVNIHQSSRLIDSKERQQSSDNKSVNSPQQS